MSNHTPGPWFIDDTGDLKGAAGAPIYFQGGNARLIAAAPELLEALQNIKANLTGRDCLSDIRSDSLRRAKDAIAKATQG